MLRLTRVLEDTEKALCDECENTAKVAVAGCSINYDGSEHPWEADYCLDCAHGLDLLSFDLLHAEQYMEATVDMPSALERNGRMHDIAGQVYGELVALYPIGYDEAKSVIWLCYCRCGCRSYVSIAHKRLKAGVANDCSYEVNRRPRRVSQEEVQQEETVQDAASAEVYGLSVEGAVL